MEDIMTIFDELRLKLEKHEAEEVHKKVTEIMDETTSSAGDNHGK
jgi:hypothetical protein